jgi:uncharacterized membrane protein
MHMASETYQTSGPTYGEPATTGWAGWIYFAAVIMVIAGFLGFIQGLIALVNDEWVVFTNHGDVYLDLTQWGWVHLIVGIVVVLAGFGLLTGNILARMAAVIVAGLSLIANFLWLPVYPVWAIIVITLDILVLWAVIVHGGELREAG